MNNRITGPLHKAMMLTEGVMQREQLSMGDGVELLRLATDLIRIVLERQTRYYDPDQIGTMFAKAGGRE